MPKEFFAQPNATQAGNSRETLSIETELSPPFAVTRPPRPKIPLVYNSPHSGRIYPQAFLEASRLDALTLRKSEDAYVEELFARAPETGAPLMHAHFPRAYLDVNREPYELDPALFSDDLPGFANTQSVRVVGGLGTIARIVTESEEIYRKPLPLEDGLARINRLYKPYHAQLSQLMMESRRIFGVAVLIDCHSMPSNPTSEKNAHRPDFVLGDRFSTTCEPGITHTVARKLKQLGYRVALNKPYAGGFITEHYGKPNEGFHSLQIEVNRGLYLNETNFSKGPEFKTVQKHITELMETLAEYAPNMVSIPKAAAE